MKTAKERKAKGEQASRQRNISKSLTTGKKSLKSSGGQCHKNTGPGTSSKMPSGIKQEEESKLHSSAKIKMQLFPLNERMREGLEKDGHNPFLELTLRPRKKISSVLEHLHNKWGSSSIAIGELMLFPYDAVLDNLTTYKSWTSSETGITAADVHADIGSPDNFRLRYGWVYAQTSGSTSFPSLGCSELGYLERVSCSTMDINCGAKMQTNAKSGQLEPSNTNEVTNEAIEQTVLAEPETLAHMSQAEVKNEESKPSKTSEIEQDAAVKGKTTTSSFKYEEPRMQNDLTFTSLLWSDSSNISIGGLLSEASLQGRFNSQDIKLGGDRLDSQPSTVISDSLDALINQFRCPQASNDLSPNLVSSILDTENTSRASESYVASSILDAENTCHSFAFPKPSSSEDFPTLGRSALSELSNKAVASGPFKCPESEASAQNGVPGCNAAHEPKTDSLPCSVGVFNNENSLDLSSIRWNDSLGPFDLPLTSRQIIKDDSISIGGFVR